MALGTAFPRLGAARCRLSLSKRAAFMGTLAKDRIHILGVGNLGKYIARGLRRSSPDLPVTLLFHRPDLLRQWEEAGQGIGYARGGYSDRTDGFDVEVLLEEEASTTSPIRHIRHLILLTKTYNTISALRRVRNRLNGDSTVMFLQNGMGTAEEACTALFHDAATRPKLWTGICSAGVYSTSPFSIVHAGTGPLLVGPNDEHASSASYMANMLNDSRDHLLTSVMAPSGIKVAQLLKLVVNAIINPLTAIFDCKNKEVLNEGPRRQLIETLVKEIGPVIRQLVPPDSRSLVDDLDPQRKSLMFSDESLMRRVHLTAVKTGANTSSMLQDVRQGRQTEIDYINGYVVANAEQWGLRCGNNRTLVELVKLKTDIKDDDIPCYFEDLEGRRG